VVRSMFCAARVGWIARTSGWVLTVGCGVVVDGVLAGGAVGVDVVAAGVRLDVVPGGGWAEPLFEQATRAAAARAASESCHRAAISTR
jgi:hypothetical protein